MRSGYAILSYATVHFQNDNFRKTLGIKQDSQIFTVLKQIKRRQRILTSNVHSNKVDMKNDKNQPNQIKTVSVMEDMINFLRNKPTVEINEELEYQLEKIDSRTNQKYLRFFIITFQFILWDGQQKIQLTVRDITQDKKHLDQRILCQLRNMMFKSFTHEIKTPLNGVVQTIDLSNGVLKKISQEKKRSISSPGRSNFKQLQGYMNSIESGIYILQNNLNDLIDYQMIENGELKINFKQFRLKECFDLIIKIIKPQISNPNVKFTAFFDQNIPIFMENDQDRIARIVLNLLLNAQKFTQQGQIKFTMKGILQKRDSSTPQNNNVRNMSFVKFEVSDSGLGIPEDKKNYIFNLFESDLMALGNINQSNHQKSAKVGLPICQLLCQKMGGQIKVNSAFGQGSKFWFILPVSQKKANPTTFGDALDTKTLGIEYEESDTENEKVECDSQKFSSEDQEESNYGLPQNFAMTSQLLNDNILCFFQQNYNGDNNDEEFKFDDEQSEIGGYQNQFAGGFQGRKSSFIPTNSKNSIIYTNMKNPRKKSQFTYQTFNQIHCDDAKLPHEELKVSQDRSPGGRARSNQKLQVNLQVNQQLQQSSGIYGGHDERKLKVNKSYDSIGIQKELISHQLKFEIINHSSPKKQSRLDGVRKLRINSNFSILKPPNRLSEGSNEDRSMDYFSDEEEQYRINGDQPFILQNIKQSKTHNEAQMGLKLNPLNPDPHPHFSNTWQSPVQAEPDSIEELFSTPCNCAQILIVDDIDMNRLMISEILRCNFNLKSDQAINGKDCLKVIKSKQFSECCSSYKIIFMDYEMPIMNGIEASRKIKQYKEQGKIDINTAVIAYTAYCDEEQNCKDAGMDFFCNLIHFLNIILVPKPASLAHIAATLREIHRQFQNKPIQQELPQAYYQVPLETGFFVRTRDMQNDNSDFKFTR